LKRKSRGWWGKEKQVQRPQNSNGASRKEQKEAGLGDEDIGEGGKLGEIRGELPEVRPGCFKWPVRIIVCNRWAAKRLYRLA